MNILALEASTTSAKAMLYHTDISTYEVLSREFEGLTDPTHYDADQFFMQTVSLGRELASGRQVDIISLSGTWHSLIVCGSDMKPVTPAYLWNFSGASGICGELRKDTAYVESYRKRTGCMVHSIYPAFKIKWLLEENPSLINCRFISLGSYFTYRLTGEIVSNRCLTSGSGLMNIHTGAYDEQILDELGINYAQLSILVDYDETFTLSEEGAKLLGLKAGIPVITTSSDGGLNQVGSGALRGGVATLSIGTSGAIRISSEAPVIPEESGTWLYRSPLGWLSGAATNGCCNCTDWAKNMLFAPGTTYSEIEEKASDNTPVFLPFLFGERCPGWDDSRRGGFEMLLPAHTAADMYRAVQEGVLFNIYHCYRILEDSIGTPSEIRLSGGILNSPLWSQICADIFGRELTIDGTMHGSLMGACVIAMDVAGEIPSALDYVSESRGTITPSEERRNLYKEKFERYLSCYQRIIRS